MKNYFLTGLFTLIPLAITVWVAQLLLGLITTPFEIIAYSITGSFGDGVLHFFLSKTLSVLFLALVLILIGYLGSHFFIQTIEKIIQKVPFINKVYKTCKDITDIFFAAKADNHSHVAVFPYPNEQQLAMGLITNRIDMDLDGTGIQSYLCIMVLGAPNPTNSMLLFFPEKDVKLTTASREEAMKYVLSCGTTSLKFS